MTDLLISVMAKHTSRKIHVLARNQSLKILMEKPNKRKELEILCFCPLT